MAPSCLLEATELTKRFGRREVVRKVSLTASSGEVVGLLGPNGAGKSTTFHMVAGLVTPDAGDVWLCGQSVGSLPLHRRARLGLGFLPQEPTVFRGLSARDNLRCVLEALGHEREESTSKAELMLTRYGLLNVAESLGRDLSGGERRRLEMARVLLHEPKVVLLDEPFAGIDPIAVSHMQTFIGELSAAGIAVLLTDHNVRETLRICHRAYILTDGRLLTHGTPTEILAHPETRAHYLGWGFHL